jgi:hypothetical protein
MPEISSAPPDEYLACLQNAILRLNGCQSKYVETATVSQAFVSFHKDTAWQGDVAVFEVYGHPTARRAYAWSYTTEYEKTRYVVVLEIPPVSSPETAVQAVIAAQIVNGTFR